MGVHELWSILEPVRKSVPLYSLSGKTLAVDLSLWVCEAQHVQAMMGRVTKPHLRNLFFRVSALTLMGVKLVFVMEGEAPELKAETMSKRNQGRFGGGQKAAAAPKSTTDTKRGRFKAVLRECAEMLDYMGVPWVTAAGEAEAMCAYLDSQGLVDGCITNDGDAFLYGARTVYRNFNMNTKDPQVDCYQTCDVQRELQLSRENLVGLAIFLGCDYIPKGIQGVGKEQALRLIHTLEGLTILQNQWKEDKTFLPEPTAKKVPHCNVCRHPGSAKAHEKRGCLLCDSKRFCEPQDFDYQCPCDWHRREQSRQALSLETNIRKYIINEFLISKDKPISHFKRRQPNMLLIQKFAYDKMEWPKHYTSEKILVLMTYTNLINKKYGKDVFMQVKPLRILKARVRNGVSCFEVLWTTPGYIWHAVVWDFFFFSYFILRMRSHVPSWGDLGGALSLSGILAADWGHAPRISRIPHIPEHFKFCAFTFSARQRRIYEYDNGKTESKAMQRDKAKEKGPYRNKLVPSAKQRYLEKLADIQNINTRAPCSGDLDHLPPCTYMDIVNYIVFGVSYYTMLEFKSHKSFESYETFCCGWVQDLALQASRW
uniref:Flap endonuclease GEN homolog 1 n=1 Tax=Neogobius melanostomus TaxID=47308 RepID=A0A8C6UKH6_9GOBI